MRTATAPAWFRLDRHDVRSTLPASLQAIMQNGLLDRVFQDALTPEFLYPMLAESQPWQGGLGDTKTFTRKGLLAPATTPLAGSDPSASTYSVEQWSVTMDQFGNSVDTNLLQSSMTLASKFMADIQTLGINAGQSLNQIARNKMYDAYAGGRTWCTTAGTSDTSLVVESVAGFTHVLVNGVPTTVSSSHPLSVTCDGTANTVTGVDAETNTLTLGTARVDVAGDAIIAANAPFSVVAGTSNDSAFDLGTGDTVSFANFRAAVTRLRKMNVPTFGGYYAAHIDPDTEAQLFADSDFKQALQGRVDSPIYRDLSIGRFAGIDWVRNVEAPTILKTDESTLTVDVVHEPIVFGAGAVIAAPFAEMGTLLAQTGVEDIPSIRMVQATPGMDVALIVRPPQDRLQQSVASPWSWVGDFGVPSDSTTGDSALFKRAVVIQHA